MLKKFSAVLAALLIIPHAALQAESAADPAQLQRDIAALRAEMKDFAQSIHGDLVALLPDIPGWTCEEQVRYNPIAEMLKPYIVPTAAFRCEVSGRDIDITFALNPSAARASCEMNNAVWTETGGGKLKSDQYRFFWNDTWYLRLQFGHELAGCFGEYIDLTANVSSSSEANNALEDFVNALLDSDPSEGAIADHATAFNKLRYQLVNRLYEQSNLLANIVPIPAGATLELQKLPPKITLVEKMHLSSALILGQFPFATGDMKIGTCQLHVMLSAGHVNVDGVRPPMEDPEDGVTNGIILFRNTERMLGQVRVDGSGSRLLLDDKVAVSIQTIPPRTPCADHPDIIHQIIDELLTHDLSVFGPLSDATQ